MTDRPVDYWQRSKQVKVILLLAWGVVSFVCGILLVNPLNYFHLGGFPLGYWFANQGALYVFVILIFVYCRVMGKLDRKHNIRE